MVIKKLVAMLARRGSRSGETSPLSDGRDYSSAPARQHGHRLTRRSVLRGLMALPAVAATAGLYERWQEARRERIRREVESYNAELRVCTEEWQRGIDQLQAKLEVLKGDEWTTVDHLNYDPSDGQVTLVLRDTSPELRLSVTHPSVKPGMLIEHYDTVVYPSTVAPGARVKVVPTWVAG